MFSMTWQCACQISWASCIKEWNFPQDDNYGADPVSVSHYTFHDHFYILSCAFFSQAFKVPQEGVYRNSIEPY